MKDYDDQIYAYFNDIHDTIYYYTQFTEWHETHPECDGWGEQEYTELKIGSLDIEQQIVNLKRFLKLAKSELLIEDINDLISKLTSLSSTINNIIMPNEQMVNTSAVAKQRNDLRNFKASIALAKKRLAYNPDESIAMNDKDTLIRKYNNLDVSFVPSSVVDDYYDILEKIETHIVGGIIV